MAAIPILIGFGFIAAFVIATPRRHWADWEVILVIILIFTAMILSWGALPELIGFRDSVYR